MPRARSPNRDKAYQIWLEHNGDITNRQIAEMLGENEKVIAVWKQRDKWKVVQQSNKSCTTNKITKKRKSPKPKQKVIEDADLTEKQRLFCLYYVKSFNATQAAIKAGYSPGTAHVQGPRMLGNVRVKTEIKRIKQEMTSNLFVEAMDVLQKYIKIAFADITDYLSFGRKEITTKDGKVQMVNYVEFKDSDQVDGTIITEVKQGKDGVSIKLEDRMKALEKLSLYFDLFPDKFKRRIAEEKLKLAQQKADKSEDDKPIEIVIKRKGEEP